MYSDSDESSPSPRFTQGASIIRTLPRRASPLSYTPTPATRYGGKPLTNRNISATTPAPSHVSHAVRRDFFSDPLQTLEDDLLFMGTAASTHKRFPEEPSPTASILLQPLFAHQNLSMHQCYDTEKEASPAPEKTRFNSSLIAEEIVLEGTKSSSPHNEMHGASYNPLNKFSAALRTSRAVSAGGESEDGAHRDDHVMQRKFKLVVDETSDRPTVEIIRVMPLLDENTAPRSRKLTGETDVTALVNIGDATLCRLIEQRSGFTAEHECYNTMCESTASLALKIHENIIVLPCSPTQDSSRFTKEGEPMTPVDQTLPVEHTRTIRIPQAATGKTPKAPPRLDFETEIDVSSTPCFVEQDDADDSDDEFIKRPSTEPTKSPEGAFEPASVENTALDADEIVFEAGKKLLRFCGEDGQDTVHSLLEEVGSCNATGVLALGSVLGKLVEEGQSSQNLLEKFAPFDPDVAWQAAQAIGAREAEAKHAGNLSQCAQLRRELITCLAASLSEALHKLSDAQEPFAALVPLRCNTDSLLLEFSNIAEKQLEAVKKDHEEATSNFSLAAARANEGTKQGETQRHDLTRFLASNTKEITSILSQIDVLYAKLETTVHARNTYLKSYAERRGVAAVQHSLAEAERHSASAALERESKRVLKATTTRTVLKRCGNLITTVRRHVENINLDSRRAREMASLQLGTICDDLYAELRTCCTGWIEVLSKNSSREQDKIASLRMNIVDATERYHQDDKQSFEKELAEAEVRFKTAQEEASNWDTLLSGMASQMSRLGRHTVLMPGVGSRPETPQAAMPAQSGGSHRVAGPRFAHQTHEWATPMRGSATPMRPLSSSSLPPSGFNSHGTPGKPLFTNEGVLVEVPLETATPPPTAGSNGGNCFAPLDFSTQHLMTDRMTVKEIVGLFDKSESIAEKWTKALEAMDIETGKDLRDMVSTPDVWRTVLLQLPLLKTNIELVMREPQRFMKEYVD